MAGDQPSDKRPEPSRDPGANAGWAALAYLIGGMTVWGVLGWLIVDVWLGFGPWGLAGGVLLGACAGTYLMLKQVG